MTGDPSDFDPQRLWQSQAKEYDAMTLAEIHRNARRLESRVQRRNAVEYVSCGVAIVGFMPALLLAGHAWMVQAGAALVMLAVVFVAWQLHRRGSVDASPLPGETLVDSYRRQLTRQRDALRTVGFWYIGPLVPGLTMLLLGMWFQVHRPGVPAGRAHAGILVTAAFAAVVFIGVWLLNLWAARRLQKRIDEL
jgi:hypothetical protein